MMGKKEELLQKYKSVWEKIDSYNEERSVMLEYGAMGQMPQRFHELVEKQVSIVKNDAATIWEHLKNYIRDCFRTFKEHTQWVPGTLPPHFDELEVTTRGLLIPGLTEIPDNNTRIDLVYLSDSEVGRLTPHCRVHGAMNKVSLFENGGGYWRCLQRFCRAGCAENALKTSMCMWDYREGVDN